MPAVVAAKRNAAGTFGVTVRDDGLIDAVDGLAANLDTSPPARALRIGMIVVGLEGVPIAGKDDLLRVLSSMADKPQVNFHVAEWTEYAKLLEMGFPDVQVRTWFLVQCTASAPCPCSFKRVLFAP